MKKIKFTLTTCYVFLITAFAQAQDADATKAYIEKYKDIAIAEMNRVGIPASITLAQGLHESGIGNSYLAKNTNNHFGIKCHEKWTGKIFKYTDDAPNECFRVYEKVEESYIDHSEFLKNRPRYASLFLLDKFDYKAWAYGLKKAGYATNPKYPEIIIKTIEENQLYRFDKPNEELASDNVEIEKEISIDVTEIKTVKEIEEDKKKTNDNIVDLNIKNPVLLNKKTSTKKITTINKSKAVRVSKNETIDMISNSVNVDKADLFAFNDITNSTKLEEGQYLFIEKKKKKNKEKKYIVKSKDNMWLIAQKKGVQLTALLKRNKLKVGEEPAIKETIYLKGKAKSKPTLRLLKPTIINTTIVADNIQQPIKNTNTNKENVLTSNILRTNDTTYPIIKENLKNTIDSNKVLSFENDRKLLDNNIKTVEQNQPKNEIKVAENKIAIVDTTKTISIAETKTIYPTNINYNELPKSTNGKHIVIKGDTMYNICKRYGITIQQLKDWNSLPDQSVKLGQALKIQQ